MTKKQLNELVSDSYTGVILDEEKVTKIANLLKRSELKEYIKQLKRHEKKLSVVITLPVPPTNDETKKYKSFFPDKKIIYDIDPTLLVGAKIQENDILTEYNLRDALEHLEEYIEGDYD